MIVLLVLVQLNHTTQLILCQGKNTTQIIELKKLNLETYNQALDYLRRLLELQECETQRFTLKTNKSIFSFYKKHYN